MKKRWCRVAAVLCAAATFLSACANDRQGAPQGTDPQVSQGESDLRFFRETEIVPRGEIGAASIAQVMLTDEGIRIAGFVPPREEAPEGVYQPLGAFCTELIAEDGSLISHTELMPEGAAGSCLGFAVAPDGRVFVAKQIYPVFDETTGETEGEMRYVLQALDADGETLWETELVPEGEEQWFSGTGLTLVGDGLFLYNFQGVSLYNAGDGMLIKKVLKDPEGYGTLTVLPYGEDALCAGYLDGAVLFLADPATGETKEEYPVPEDAWFHGNVTVDAEGRICIGNDTGVSGFFPGEETVEELLVYTDSDLLIHSVQSVAVRDADEIYVVYNVDAEYHMGREFGFGGSGSEDRMRLSRLTLTDAAEIANRTVLRLGTTSRTSYLTNQVVRFNQTNPDYRIEIVDYSEYDSAENEWNGAAQQMNREIIEGNAPDLLALYTDVPIEGYLAKGVLLPLDDYLREDAELKDAPFFQNIFDAFAYDGRTYLITPAVTMQTCALRRSDAEGDGALSLAGVRDLMERYEITPAAVFGPDVSREILMQEMIGYGSAHFTDWENGNCDFTNEAFLDQLRFAEAFPTADTMQADTDWEARETLWRRNEALLYAFPFREAEDYRRVRYGVFGEEIACTGYPETGNLLQAEELIGINAACENPDACWAFLRTYLTKEFQDALPMGFPVRTDSFDTVCENARKPLTYVDENGTEQVQEETTYVGGESLPYPRLTEEDCARMKELFATATRAALSDGKILQIIEEESGAFFAGQKTVEEVAVIIKSRAEIYLRESR